MGEDIQAQADGAFETATRWFLAAVVFALPLAFHPGLFDLYDGTKRLVAHVGTGLSLLMWASGGPARGGLTFRVAAIPAALGVLIAFELPSLLVAVNLTEAALELGNRLLWLSALVVGVHAASRREHLDQLCALGLAGAVIASVVGIVQAIGWSREWLPQVAVPASTFGNKNMGAEYVLLFVPIALYLVAVRPERVARGLAAVGFGLTSAYVVLTGTRASLVGMAVFVPVMAAGLAHMLLIERSAPDAAATMRRRLTAGLAVAVLVWGLTIGFLKVGPSLIDPAKRRSPFNEANAAMTLSTFSSNWRLIVWTNTLAMIKDAPVFGVGLGNWRYLYPRYHRKIAVDTDFNSRVQADTAHNDYVQAFAETGLVGMVGLVLCLAVLIGAFGWWLVPWRPGNEDRAEAGAERLLGNRVAVLSLLGALLALGVDAAFSFPAAKAAPTFAMCILLGALEGVVAARMTIPISGGPATVLANACGVAAFAIVAAQGAWAVGDVHFKAGLMLYNQGRVLEAHERLEMAYRFRKHDPSLAVFHGGITQELGKIDEALEINLRARRQHPNFTNVLNQLGNIYWKKAMVKEAEEAYREVLEIHPEFVEALRNLGSLYIASGRFGEARTQLERLVAKEPDDPANVLDLGEVYRALAKRERSRETLSSLVTRWPDNARGHLALGHLSREEKKYDAAEKSYRRALAIAPGTPPRFFLATLLADRGRFDEGIALLEEARKADPKNTMVSGALAKMARATGRPAPPTSALGPLRSGDLPRAAEPPVVDAAEASLRELLVGEPRSPGLHGRLAELYLRQGRFTEAAQELKRTIEADPKRPLAWAKLAKLAHRAGRKADANQLLIDGIRNVPKDPTLWNELGLLIQEAGQHDRALEAFENAAASPGVPAEVWFNVGMQRKRAGKTAGAIEAFRRFVAEWKGEPGPRAQAEAEIARLSK